MTTIMNTHLTTRVLARADADELPNDHELRRMARDFDILAGDFFANKDPRALPIMCQCWSQLRRAWNAYSGETKGNDYL